jgi:hypothetical protein
MSERENINTIFGPDNQLETSSEKEIIRTHRMEDQDTAVIDSQQKKQNERQMNFLSATKKSGNAMKTGTMLKVDEFIRRMDDFCVYFFFQKRCCLVRCLCPALTRFTLIIIIYIMKHRINRCRR